MKKGLITSPDWIARRPRSGGQCSIALLVLLPVSFFLASLCPAVARPVQAPKPQQSLTVIRGALGAIPGKGPFLTSGGKQVLLSGQSAYILKTLEDKRLLNQELQLTGTFTPDGSFSVQKLYAVRDGKLYRIQYYCEICNITYVQPGHCYWCGRETKLQEVPVQTGAQ